MQKIDRSLLAQAQISGGAGKSGGSSSTATNTTDVTIKISG
ncbi:hypothetical protein AWB82_00280 [Caballeronia glebae]|uniref:Uncharacterized protein n=1 Tax=Caballeronia glebae TaxID=1777143 RepID=A0A157Z6L2_9BURK|nr:hypothetical protein AWB82_00280 [Caballeronia glebae]